MKSVRLISCLFIAIAYGCSMPLPPNETTPLPMVLDIEVAEDKSAITGRIISNFNDKYMEDIPVRLARVFWDPAKKEGAYVLDGANSPGTLSQTSGIFVIEDIEPGDYVIVIGDVFSKSVIISKADGTAEIYTTLPGAVLEVGDIHVDLP